MSIYESWKPYAGFKNELGRMDGMWGWKMLRSVEGLEK